MGLPLVNTNQRSITLVPKDSNGFVQLVLPGSVEAFPNFPAITCVIDPVNQLHATIIPADGFTATGANVEFRARNLSNGLISTIYTFDVIAEAPPVATTLTVVENGDSPKS